METKFSQCGLFYIAPEEIKRTLQAFHSDGDVFEIRLICGKWNASGYFSDADTAIKALQNFKTDYQSNIKKAKKAQIYFTINSVDRACYSRDQHDCFIENSPNTADKDIPEATDLLIDVDPVRISGISSTDAEKQSALEVIRKVTTYLKEHGLQPRLKADSGNGYHVHYVFTESPENTAIFEKVLEKLNCKFGNDTAHVDTTVFNPARICKLYGTFARKGSSTPERPHRPAQILEVNSEKVNDIAILKQVLDELETEFPTTEHQTQKPNTTKHSPKHIIANQSAFENSCNYVSSLINDGNLTATKEAQQKDGCQYFYIVCPFDSSHVGKDTAVIVSPDGTIAFHCFHDSCKGKKWYDVCQKIGVTYFQEHTANSRQQARENHQKYVSPYDVNGTGRLTIANLQAYMQRKGFSVAYDEILRENVFGTVDGESKLHLPETMPTIIKDDLQGELKGVNRDNICAMLDLIASRNIVNPIRSMIEGTKWDGIDRLKQFYDLFEIPETDTLSRVLIRKWAMQCICGLYNQFEHPFSLDIILVFQGKQGISKTRFFEHLAMMPEYFKESAVLDPASKDSIIECTGVWIAELGEIGSTMRKDVDRVKGFLSQSTDTYRQPYGRKALKYPRRTSFVGTVNDSQFLLDQTGNRRFASVPLQLTHTLDYETQIKTFDALQFWAQILQIVRDAIAQGATMGGCFRLDENEKANLENRNNTLLKPLPFEQEFLDTIQYYEERKAKSPKSVEWRFCTSTDWLVQNRYRMGNCSAVQLGKILAKNGYERKMKKINGIPKYGYELPFDLPQTLC